MNKLLLLIGIFMICIGLLWIGQGLGYIAWPASSFMISQIKWAYYGAGVVLVGLVVGWFSRR